MPRPHGREEKRAKAGESQGPGRPAHPGIAAPLVPRFRSGVYGSGRRDGVGRLEREQLLPVNGDIAGCLDAQPDLAAINVHDGDTDILTDENLLTQFPAENQHDVALPISQPVVNFLPNSTPRIAPEMSTH